MGLTRGAALIASTALVCLTACDKPRTETPADSTVDSQSTVVAPTRSWSGSWAPELGEMFIVPADSENAAVVVFPDAPTSGTVASSPVTLVNTTGDTIAPRVMLRGPDSLQCGDAAVVRMVGTIPAGWSLGLQSGASPPIHLDSIEGLPPIDSARIVADLARLASGLGGKEQSRFSGLPFAVVAGRRFDLEHRSILVAQLVRRLPQEASPLEERTLLIAERSRSRDSVYAVAYNQRSEGSEETAEHFETLAVVRGRATTLLLLARDRVSRTDYQILERSAAGRWRVRWNRPLAC